MVFFLFIGGSPFLVGLSAMWFVGLQKMVCIYRIAFVNALNFTLSI